jgi:ribosomal protein S18 acetylase RimI-like enzyme
MKGLSIAPFVIEDTDAVLDVWQQTGLPGARVNPRAAIQKKLKFQPESFFVGRLDGKLVTTVMAGYDGHRGWLYMLAVLPAYQRRGIGSAMAEHAENWLRQLGCTRVKLQVEPGKPGPVEFYRRLGYETQQLLDMVKEFRAPES